MGCSTTAGRPLHAAKGGAGTAPAALGRKSRPASTALSAKRSLSFGGFVARAEVRDERKVQLEEAEAWCEKTGKGA